MNRIGARVRALLLCLLLLTGSMSGNVMIAAAQSDEDVDPELFESELSGIEVEATGDFAIYQAELQEYRHGQGEIVNIASNTAYVQVSFFDDTDTNQETLEIYNDAFSGEVDSFDVLDDGEGQGTVWTFAIAEFEGVEFYYYLSVTEDVEDNVDVLQRIFATDATFFEDFVDAQESITIGRDGFLEDVDVADLEEIAGDAAGQREDEPTEEPTGEATEEATEEPTEEATEEPVEAVPTIDPATGSTYDFQIVDGQIVATSDVAIRPSFVNAPAMEEVPLEMGDAQGTVFLFLRPMSPEETLEMLLQIFTPEGGTRQNVGTDADRTSAWSLDIMEDANGEQAFFYAHVQNDRFNRYHYAEFVFAPIGELEETLDAFGQNVQINGIPMFAEADRETIAFLLDGGETTERQTGGDEGTETEEKNNQTGEGTDEPTGLDLESQGLISETEYESPQYGVTVEWDDSAWAVDLEWELTARSDVESGVDSVIVLNRNNSSSMMIQIMPAGEGAPADFVDVWSSPDYMVESVHEDAEVLLSDSGRDSGAVVYLTYDSEGEELILVQEVIFLDDDTIAWVTMFGNPADIADGYADAEDFVAIDGGDSVGTFTPREIERALP